MTNAERRATIPDHLVPKRCDQCDFPLREWRETDDWNQFTCSNPKKAHSRWIQSKPAACAILVDEYDTTYLVVRAIPPAVGGKCFPGGHSDYGEVAEETIVHETLHEACIRIYGRKPVYVGQWFIEGPGVAQSAYVVRILRSDLDVFVPNHEASERIPVDFWTLDPDVLAFSGQKLALAAARELLRREAAWLAFNRLLDAGRSLHRRIRRAILRFAA